MTAGYISYRIYFQPLITPGIYGDEVEITKNVYKMLDITKSLEGDNTDFGQFKFSNVKISVDNSVSQFANFFNVTEDRCKVKITFDTPTTNPAVIFNGLIDALGTTKTEDSITFTVTGLESALKLFVLPTGTIANGDTTQEAITKVLQLPEFFDYFVALPSNINVGFNPIIDNAAYYDNLPIYDVLRELLLISDSLIYNVGLNIKVNSRDNLNNTPAEYKYASLYGDNNILEVYNYSTGLNRLFNTFIINDTIKSIDANSINSHGARKKEIDIKGITNTTTLQSIADALRDRFSTIKQEIDLVIAAENELSRIEFLSNNLINIQRKAIPASIDSLLPVYNSSSRYDSDVRYPIIRGNIQINTNFKLIGSVENNENKTVRLKFREI